MVCVLTCGMNVCPITQTADPEAARQWPRTSAPCANTSRFSWGSWDGNLRGLNATSGSWSLPGQSKTPYFITPEEEGVWEQIWICDKMLWLSPNCDWDELLFFFFFSSVLSWGNYP